MKRIVLTIQYDGTNYCGWQKQKNVASVQGEVERAVYLLTGETVTVTGSGRTDAGVHALAQTAHFDTRSNIPPKSFANALNTFLPYDIKVLKSALKTADFSARKSAKRKTYRYSFYYSPTVLPLFDRYAVNLQKKPDVFLMKKGAEYIVGEHDFKCFCASKSSVKTTVRTVYEITFKSTASKLDVFVTGNGFLYNMVRIICGTLLDVGYGKIAPQEIENVIDKKERTFAGRTLPSKALTLVKVVYR